MKADYHYYFDKRGVFISVTFCMPLPAPDRASQLAMSAFLTPIGEIFAFLEDAMVVRVGYALAADRKSELNLLLHISTIGGLVCGVVAFLCMVAVAFNESAAAAVLNPSAGPTPG